MTDIVGRLRHMRAFAVFGDGSAWQAVGEACDEIVRLRADLRQVGSANEEFSLGGVRDRAEIERLRAALDEIRDLHQPMWVSEEAKAAGKKPWVCCWCGTADGSWPCDTRLLVDEALEGDDR